MPPRHGKSNITSEYFPAWCLGNQPTDEVIACSYSADLATSFGRKVRNLVDSNDYQNIFKTKLAEDSKSKGQWNTQEGGGYVAAGVGGSITGKGAKILLIDDPIKNREEAESQIVRDSIWEWYTSTAYTRLAPGGCIVVIQTRWHEDDLVGRLNVEEQNGGDKWTRLSFPAIAEKDEDFRKQGEALWEDQYPVEELLKIKRNVGPYNWSALYQQRPVDEESQEFKTEWFKKISFTEVQRLETRNFITIDTAISQKASADYTGITINYVDRENKWYLKSWRVKLNPLELIDLLFTLYRNVRPDQIGIEKTIYLMAIKPFLDQEMAKRDCFLPITELSHNQTAKETRIRGLIPRYASGNIYHIEGECVDLEEEFIRFPKSMNDDVMDSAAYQLQLAEAPGYSELKQEFNLYGTSYN